MRELYYKILFILFATAIIVLASGCGSDKHTYIPAPPSDPPTDVVPAEPCEVMEHEDGISVVCSGDETFYPYPEYQAPVPPVLEPPACRKSKGKARDKNPNCK